MCGTDPNSVCNDPVADGFPGGYRSVEPCSAMQPCAVGSTCAALGGESAACFKDCATNADCRGPDYSCREIAAIGTWVSGASSRVCYLKP